MTIFLFSVELPTSTNLSSLLDIGTTPQGCNCKPSNSRWVHFTVSSCGPPVPYNYFLLVLNDTAYLFSLKDTEAGIPRYIQLVLIRSVALVNWSPA